MLCSVLLTFAVAVLAQHESINAPSEYSSINPQSHSAFQDLSASKNSDVPDSNNELKINPQYTHLIMSSASLDRSNGIPTPGISLINSTATLAGVMLVSSGSEKIAEVSSNSRLNVRDTLLVSDTLSTAPFVSSGNVLLSGFGIDIPSEYRVVDTLCEGMIGDNQANAGWIAFENSVLDDLIVGNPMKKGLVSGGVYQKEVVRGVQFVNISCDTATEDEQPEHEEESWVFMSRMKDCNVSNSFDSVHGGIVAGVGPRSVGGFECINSSFVGITRERDMYGDRRARRDAFERSGVRKGEMNSASDCDVDMDQHKTYVYEQGDEYAFKNTNYPGCNATYGGAINIQGAYDESYYYTLEISNCFFQSCKSTVGEGGAVAAWHVYVATVTNTKFLNCEAFGAGGSLYFDRDSSSDHPVKLTMKKCTFSNSKTFYSGHAGGAICCYYIVAANFSHCTFTNCFAVGEGGAIYLDRGTDKDSLSLLFDTCSFSKCKSTNDYGGAVSAYWPTKVDITHTNFTGCTAHGNGGSLYLCGPSNGTLRLSIETCNFTDNAATNGGALWARYLTNSSIKDTKFFNCKTPSGKGGALYLYRKEGTILFRDDLFNENTAAQGIDIYLIAASGFNASSGITLTNTFTYPCRNTTNYAVVSNKFQCGDFDYDNFYISTNAGSDTGCRSQSNTACKTLSSALPKGRAEVIALKMCEGTYHVSTSLAIGTKTVIVTVADDDYVTYALDASNINYFTATTGNLTLSRFTLAPTKSSYSASVVKIDEGILIIRGIEMSGYTGSAPVLDFTGWGVRIDGESVFENITNTNYNGCGSVLKAYINICVGRVEIVDSYFENCRCNGQGGAFYLNASIDEPFYWYYSLGIDACAFTNCQATTGAGGVFYASWFDGVTITNSDFYGCGSNLNGGSLYLDRSKESPFLDLKIDCCTFSDNKAGTASSGGAIFAKYAITASIVDSTFTNCSSGLNGGALSLSSSDSSYPLNLTVASCTFTECVARSGYSRNGGAVSAASLKDATIKNTVFEDCTTNYQGGALYLDGKAFPLNVTGCLFSSCISSSASGGAIYANNCSNVSVTNSRFQNNTAQLSGGAFYLQRFNGSVYFHDSILLDNTASKPGIDIWLSNNKAFTFGYTTNFQLPTSTKPCTDNATNYPELSKLVCKKPIHYGGRRANSDDE